MIDQKPYLIRAIYEWIADNGARPHVLVDTSHPNVRIPAHLYEKASGKPFEAFNIAMSATSDLHMDNEYITCNARFGGKRFNLVLPIDAIATIYTPDPELPGGGMQFPYVRHKDRPQLTGPSGEETPAVTTPAPSEPEPPTPTTKERPSFLKVVK